MATIQTTIKTITVLAGAELDVTTDPRCAGIQDPCIKFAWPTGYNFNFSARNKGNTDGLVEDHAVNGIYSTVDANCATTPPMLLALFADKIYVKTGADPVKVIITPGVQGGI